MVSFLKTLNETKKRELLELLKSQEVLKVDLKSTRQEAVKDYPIACPKCHSQSIIDHGQDRCRIRFIIKVCHHIFNELINTKMVGLKKPDKFPQSVIILIDSFSIRKAAKKLGISKHIAFDWRHKILSGLADVPLARILDLVECDDKYHNRPP